MGQRAISPILDFSSEVCQPALLRSVALIVCFMARARTDGHAGSQQVSSSLESREFTAWQEAELMARCKPAGRGDPSAATPVDQVQEESILAGLGVIGPDEIGANALSKCVPICRASTPS